MTMGEMMFYGGIVGAIVCLITLLSTWKIFAKQRKKLLEFIEQL